MPRQKLTWKQPKRVGKAGQVQQKGSQDPEHQQAPDPGRPGKKNLQGKKAATPRLANKEKAL
jgi:hypothetical protein